MDILGIGVPELVFILLIALIVLGPNDMQKAGKTVGTWMRKIVLSDEWRGIKNASRKLKTLPNELMREAGQIVPEVRELEKFRNKDIKETMPKDDFGVWSGIPVSRPASDNHIAPHADKTPASVQTADASPVLNSPSDSDFVENDNA